MNNLKKTFHSGRAVFFLLIFICVILGAAVLKITASVILPFVIAIMLAFVMFPLLKFLEKFKIPRLISILLIVAMMGVVLYIFGMVIYNTGKNIPSLYPEYEKRLTAIYEMILKFFELETDENLSFWQNLWAQSGIRNWVFRFGASSVTALLNFITNAILVIIVMVFVLLEASYFKEKLEIAFEGRSEKIDNIGKELISQVTRYLTAKFFVSLGTGIIVAVGTWLIGLDFAIVWGLLAFVLNFIPTFGSIVSGAITSLFALLQFWGEPNAAVFVVLTVILMISVNMIIGNVIDPKVIGDNVGLSPVIILISLAGWGFIWGFAGMVLSVPMTVIIKIICENIPVLEPVSVFLGSRRATKAKQAEPDKNDSSAVDWA